MNDVQVERIVTIPRTGGEYTGSHGFVSTGDSSMQNGFVSQRVYQTQQRTWTGNAVGRSLSVDTSQHDHMRQVTHYYLCMFDVFVSFTVLVAAANG